MIRTPSAQAVVTFVSAEIIFLPEHDDRPLSLIRREIYDRAVAVLGRQAEGGTQSGGVKKHPSSDRPRAALDGPFLHLITQSSLQDLAQDLGRRLLDNDPDTDLGPRELKLIALWAGDVFAEIHALAEAAGTDFAYSGIDDGATLTHLLEYLKSDDSHTNTLWEWKP